MTRILVAALLVTATSAEAQRGWSAQVMGGAAWNLRTSLSITQRGAPDLKLTARYDTRALETPPYYAVRIGRWSGRRAWEVELVHHKLYLANAPSEVQRFSISHGYNLATANYAVLRGALVVRAGAGVVITHPESTIRQQALAETGGILGTGYYVSGPTVQLSGERRIALTRRVFVAAEGKLTASYARVPVREGHASVPNVALHALLGIGYR
jgi:hypothetical protein